ncbi:hypothetical protein ACVWZP_003572 [Pseudomonas sp. TE36184]
MSRTLIRKNPSNFKTLPLHVEATPEGLSYQSVGMPLNFAQTLQRRKPVEVTDPERFALELANLGVSVRLTLHWQNKDYWVGAGAPTPPGPWRRGAQADFRLRPRP